MADQAVLSVDGLDVCYGDLQVLWDVSLQVEKGKIVSIIGANGAGKSTLLKTITGAMTPKKGTVNYHGKNINHLQAYQTVAGGIAMVPEGRRIFPRLTVRENLIIGSYTPHARKKVNIALDKVQKLFPILKDRANQMGTDLSGGEQQMLAIGRALMCEPELLMFDEISLGLAPLIIKNIYEKVKEINREGMTIILVEQDIKRSLKAADMAYVLLEGRVTLKGRPQDLTEENVKKAYFGV